MKKHSFPGMFFRSFLLQSVWNFERMQNVGFLFTVLPSLKKIYPDKKERLIAIKSHNNFFNTHPYMAGIIAGLMVAFEEEKKQGTMKEDELQTLKSNIAGPIAAIGDTFFWATWRPLCALLLVSLVLIYGKFISETVSFIAIISFLVLYNSLHFAVRYTGIKRSYEYKTKIFKTITELNTQKMTDAVRTVGVIFIWATIILYFLLIIDDLFTRLFFIAAFIASVVFSNKGISPAKLFYFITIVAIMFRFIFPSP